MKSNQLKKPPKDSAWTPSPLNWIKLNFDAVIREDKFLVAVVARDQRGSLQHGQSSWIRLSLCWEKPKQLG